jgi:hypothetical protein
MLLATGTAIALAFIPPGSSHAQARLRANTATPRCFGAAAHAPERRCRNPGLTFTVVPTPAQAELTPDAPCTVVERDKLVEVCAFGTPRRKATSTIALVGDSHASHWRAALEVLTRTKGWRGLSITRPSCPFTQAVPSSSPEPLRSQCVQWKREVLLWFGRHPEVSTVFVSEFAGGENQQVLHWFADVEPIIPSGNNVPEAEVVGYLRAWEALPPSVKHIVVIRDTPKIHGDTLGCVERAIARRERAGLACAVRRSGALYPPDPAAAAAITLHSPRVQLVDLTPFLCDRLLCDPVIGGALVYRDPHHLTRTFATTLGPYLLQQVDRLMALGRTARRGPAPTVAWAADALRPRGN